MTPPSLVRIQLPLPAKSRPKGRLLCWQGQLPDSTKRRKARWFGFAAQSVRPLARRRQASEFSQKRIPGEPHVRKGGFCAGRGSFPIRPSAARRARAIACRPVLCRKIYVKFFSILCKHTKIINALLCGTKEFAVNRIFGFSPLLCIIHKNGENIVVFFKNYNKKTIDFYQRNVI